MPYFVVVVGTAGSGKSSLTSMLQTYLTSHQLDSITVNLDPAVEELPYQPDVDIRDYVDVYTVMKQTGLGPNGALIASVDMVLSNISDLVEEVYSYRSNYVIIDTPGQMELFAFRETGPLVVRALVGDHKAASVYVIDAAYATSPSNLLSAMLLSASAHVRLGFPQVNVVTKVDMVPEEELSAIREVLDDPGSLSNRLAEDRYARLIWTMEEVEDLVEKLAVFDHVFVSNKTGEGFDDLYAALQRVFAGGEDYFTEEPNPVL